MQLLRQLCANSFAQFIQFRGEGLRNLVKGNGRQPSPNLVMEQPLLEILQSLRSLEPFPQSAVRVLELAGREETGPNDVVEWVQIDPGLTTKVLRLCNSAYYGFRREIVSVSEAGNALGLKALVNLVLTCCASRYFQAQASLSGESTRRLWRTCLTNALACRLLASTHRRADPERAYTAGLLQNMGQLVLERFACQARPQLLAQMHAGANRLEAERRVLGMTHAEIGARLATRWHLPEQLVDTIRNHHEPEKATQHPLLAATGHVAELLTWTVRPVEQDSEPSHDFAIGALQQLGLDPEQLAPLTMRLRENITKASELFSAQAA